MLELKIEYDCLHDSVDKRSIMSITISFWSIVVFWLFYLQHRQVLFMVFSLAPDYPNDSDISQNYKNMIDWTRATMKQQSASHEHYSWECSEPFLIGSRTCTVEVLGLCKSLTHPHEGTVTIIYSQCFRLVHVREIIFCQYLFSKIDQYDRQWQSKWWAISDCFNSLLTMVILFLW